MNHLVNVDIFPYNDKLTPIVQILETFGVELEVSSMGTSISTSRFMEEIKTLTLIIYSNLYPLINTGFISHGRAQFLCDLINRAPIDICAHIFHILRQTARRSAARTCLPFCSLIMKIITLQGIHPLKNGTVLPRHGMISLHSFQSSKVHSSTKRAKKSPSKPPKSGSQTSFPASPIGKSSAVPSASKLPKTLPPHTLEP